MKRQNRLAGRILGLIAALISPVAAYALNFNITLPASATVTSPNNGGVILYRPAENAENGIYSEPVVIEPETAPDYSPGYSPGYSKDAVEVLSLNISDDYEDLSVFSADDGNVIVKTFGAGEGEKYINLDKGGQVRNQTDIPNQTLIGESRLLPGFVPEKNGEPQVLIMHTHTSESYQPNDSGHYDTGYTSRTVDPQKSVVAVGAKIAEGIAKHGYTVIHDGTVHDNPAYNGAYERSAETVKSILARYPSIKIVLDVHRDAIIENDAPVAAVAQINGSEAAQIMFISAADDGTRGIPDFLKNFRLACLLQSEAESDYPGLTRPVLFQYCGYNQELSPGSLLVEIGSHGNTLEQACYAGELLGDSIGAAMERLS